MTALSKPDWLQLKLPFEVRAISGQGGDRIIRGDVYEVTKLDMIGENWTGRMWLRDESGHSRYYYYNGFEPVSIPEGFVYHEGYYLNDPQAGQF